MAQFVGQTDREVQWILIAPVFGLVQGLFDFPELFLKGIGLFDQGHNLFFVSSLESGRIVLFGKGIQFGIYFPDFLDGLVGPIHCSVDIVHKFMLFLHIGNGSFRRGVGNNLKSFGNRFAVNVQDDLVIPGHCFGAVEIGPPENHPVQFFSAFASGIPYVGVTTFLNFQFFVLFLGCVLEGC